MASSRQYDCPAAARRESSTQHASCDRTPSGWWTAVCSPKTSSALPVHDCCFDIWFPIGGTWNAFRCSMGRTPSSVSSRRITPCTGTYMYFGLRQQWCHRLHNRLGSANSRDSMISIVSVWCDKTLLGLLHGGKPLCHLFPKSCERPKQVMQRWFALVLGLFQSRSWLIGGHSYGQRTCMCLAGGDL